jgi:CheY-like chemotaxis protein
MPRGGKLTFKTAPVLLEDEPSGPNALPQARPFVMLVVSDNGHGMDEATTARLLNEDLFTTKKPDEGHGLGFPIIREIIQQSGGKIGVLSALGHGTTFTIYLPCATEKENTPPALSQAPHQPARRGSETIMLVEDNDAVRSLLRELLHGYGYTVLAASDCGEALRLGEQYGGPIHLVVTDVVMPGMDGPDLVSRLGVVRPGIKVLYISGYPLPVLVQHGMPDMSAAFLQKPFSNDALIYKVHEVLEQ